MTARRVDYDRLAEQYEERYAVNPLAGVGRALVELVARERPRRVLEVGCGTGHWLRLLVDPSVRLLGVDASLGMLLQARSRGASGSICSGSATALPLHPESVDLMFVVNAIHHFGDLAGFVREAAHALVPGGVLALVGVHPLEFADTWYPYQYFPGNYEADIRRFPSREDQLGALADAGFHEPRQEVVDRVEAVFSGREVLADPFLRRESNSSLAQLTEEVYAEGRRSIDAAIDAAEASGETISFVRALNFEMLSARLAD